MGYRNQFPNTLFYFMDLVQSRREQLKDLDVEERSLYAELKKNEGSTDEREICELKLKHLERRREGCVESLRRAAIEIGLKA